MKLIDRYILKTFAVPFFYCLGFFITIYIVIDLFGHLDEIIKQHIGLTVLIPYYLVYMPNILVHVSPVAMLISTMYALGVFTRHNEITAMRASGIGIWKILKPILVFGFLVSCFVLLVNDKIVTKTKEMHLNIKREKIEMKKPGDKKINTIRNVAVYGTENRIIYAKIYDPDPPTLKDLIIHQQDNKLNVKSKTNVRMARWNNKKWYATDITVYDLDSSGRIINEPRFLKNGILDIRETPEDFEKQRFKIEFMTYRDLSSYIDKLSGISGGVVQKLSVEAHNRLSFPFINLVIILIGAAFALKTKRGSRLRGVAAGFTIGIIFYSVTAISIAFGKGGLLPPIISAWLPNVMFAGWGAYLINQI